MAKFGAESRANLADVHPRLQELFEFVVRFWDCKILDGRRTVEEQIKNVAKGVSKTMASKHIDGLAVDAMPYPVDWTAIQKGLDAIKRAEGGMQIAEAYMFAGFVAGVAAAKGIQIRQGVDWDGDRDFADQTFHDLPHTELVL